MGESHYQDRDEVIVVDYDDEWLERFERERMLIAGALGDLAVSIEHVGSTAVPGCAAKPVIDIMIGLRTLAEGERCIAPLEAIGYEFRGDGGIAEHLFFRRGKPRTHHLHMVERGGSYWNEHIAFRELLRTTPELAREYGALKKRLAARYRTQRVEYTEAKTPFVRAALAQAEATPG